MCIMSSNLENPKKNGLLYFITEQSLSDKNYMVQLSNFICLQVKEFSNK